MAKPRIVEDDEIIVPKKKEESNGLFHEILDLPSKYRLYPEGTKFYGRPLFVKELKKLASMNEDNHTSIINEILSTAIKGIDINEIYVADKIYLILWLRANTYKNSDFSIKYRCPECKAENSYMFGVEHLDIKYLPDNYKLEPLTLINTEDEIEFDFPKIKDENRIKFFKENSSRNKIDDSDEDDLNIASYIRKINGETVNLQRAYDFIKTLEQNPEDYMNILSHISDMDFGMSQEILVTCKNPKCEEVNHLPISFRPEFFLPKIGSR